MGDSATRMRLAIVAGIILAVVLVPVALAGSGPTRGSPATASAGVKKKVKALAKRVQALQQELAGVQGQLAALQAEQGGGRPPSGAAAGDLTGNYPNPAIAAGAVNSDKVANNSLTGADVDETSLETVPEAGNSDTLDGISSAGFVPQDAGSIDAFEFQLFTTDTNDVFDFGPLRVQSFGTAHQFRVCNDLSNTFARTLVIYVGGVRTQTSHVNNGCVTVNLGTARDFQVYGAEGTFIFGIQRADVTSTVYKLTGFGPN